MNRGSWRDAPLSRHGPRGFNEAPIHESGKLYRIQPSAPLASGFNEAPIHESGKYPRLRWTVSCIACFNEAPIHESGKSLRQLADDLGAMVASMRPRFMNRGSAIAASGTVRSSALQ